jgi:predicted DNA-binding ribbon-helix-helix protein
MKIRTSLYLEQDELEELRKISQQEDLSISQILRRLIIEFLNKKRLDKIQNL